MNPKCLVRPDDFSIYDLDESNGRYRLWSPKRRLYTAMEHSTFEYLTKEHGFFPIEENELGLYQEKCNEYYRQLSWQNLPNELEYSNDGTNKEYLDSPQSPTVFSVTKLYTEKQTKTIAWAAFISRIDKKEFELTHKKFA